MQECLLRLIYSSARVLLNGTRQHTRFPKNKEVQQHISHLRQHVHKALLVHSKVQLASHAPDADVANHPAAEAAPPPPTAAGKSCANSQWPMHSAMTFMHTAREPGCSGCHCMHVGRGPTPDVQCADQSQRQRLCHAAMCTSFDLSKMLDMPTAAAICRMQSRASHARWHIMLVEFPHHAALVVAMSATCSRDSCMHTTTAAQETSPAALMPLHLPLHVAHL